MRNIKENNGGRYERHRNETKTSHKSSEVWRKMASEAEATEAVTTNIGSGAVIELSATTGAEEARKRAEQRAARGGQKWVMVAGEQAREAENTSTEDGDTKIGAAALARGRPNNVEIADLQEGREDPISTMMWSPKNSRAKIIPRSSGKGRR